MGMQENVDGLEGALPVGRGVLPVLSLTRFIAETPGVLTGLLLFEIGLSFNNSVGVTGQIRTFASVAALFSAIVVSAINVRYNPKHLLMLGVLLVMISSLGCCMANSFIMFLLFYSITGVGLSLVIPMSSTLVAEYYPEEQRVSSIGWLLAGGSLSWVIGAQVITYLSGIGGWRLAYSHFVVMFLLIGLLLGKLFLPTPIKSTATAKINYKDGMRVILKNRSAVYCLLSTILRMASFQLILVYSASYLREVLFFSREITSVLVTISALSYTFGSLISGRFVRKYGRKQVSFYFLFLAGVMFAVFTTVGHRYLSLLVYFIGPFSIGVGSSSVTGLFLEQVPEYRGTMMAFTTASGNLGSALGAGIGGAMLLLWGYTGMGLSLGSLGVLGAFIIYFLVQDKI